MIFYTIKKDYVWYTVMKVTSEKGGGWGRKQYYGSINGIPTHCVSSDTFGRFETPEAATIPIDQIRAIKAKHKPLIDEAQRQYINAQNAEQAEIDACLK